jgi:lipoyl synthase
MNFPRKPEWLKVKRPNSPEFAEVRGVLARFGLHSVCQEARCPNMGECFHSGTATFLILGNICTRHCRYCNVQQGIPRAVDDEEPERLVLAARTLNLRYVVITSVTRDDLPDGGAGLFARCVENLRREIPGCEVEVLIPDLQGNWEALDRIIESRPDVINHNMEVVRNLFREQRPQGNYDLSLRLLEHVRRSTKSVVTKSGFIIGLGETREEILTLMKDLASVHCKRLTIGQYLQPSRRHEAVHRYYAPQMFDELKSVAGEMGFGHVESGPLVRSSYHAALLP